MPKRAHVRENEKIRSVSFRQVMIPVANDLLSNGIKEILNHEAGAYPSYVHCFRFLIGEEVYRKGEHGKPSSKAVLSYLKTPKYIIGRLASYLKRILAGKRELPEEVDILFLSRYRPIEDNGTRSVKTDYLFDNIIYKIDKSPFRPKMALITLGMDGKHYTDDRVVNANVLDFLSLRILLKSIFHSFSLFFKYEKISKKLSNVQERIFSQYFTLPNLVHVLLFDCSLGQAIQDLKPKMIVTNDDVARLKPSGNSYSKMVVLQSALMVEDKEKYWNSLYSSLGLEERLLSDCFCVSGPSDKSVKEKFPFDTKKVIVTGQPRFDKLTKANEIYNKSEVYTKFSLPNDKKILLWATQTHGLSSEENKENISAMYHIASSRKDFQLVIKLHPEEDQKAPLYQNHSYHPTIVGGNKDIDELLCICDVFITKSSTSAIEASILNIPTIVLNMSKEPNDYIEKGVALGVYDREELIPAIESILYDEKIRNRLAKARENFVYEYAYLQDGRASERVANLIEKMIQN